MCTEVSFIALEGRIPQGARFPYTEAILGDISGRLKGDFEQRRSKQIIKEKGYKDKVIQIGGHP